MTVQAEVLTIERNPSAWSHDLSHGKTQLRKEGVLVYVVHQCLTGVMSGKQVVEKK
jgi:hypothetical protein